MDLSNLIGLILLLLSELDVRQNGTVCSSAQMDLILLSSCCIGL